MPVPRPPVARGDLAAFAKACGTCTLLHRGENDALTHVRKTRCFEAACPYA
jgi:hypothetical protein